MGRRKDGGNEKKITQLEAKTQDTNKYCGSTQQGEASGNMETTFPSHLNDDTTQ